MYRYLITLIIFISLLFSLNGNCQSWSSVGYGVNSNVYSFAVDSVNNELYVGGWFLTAGGISSPHIAKWNGNSWVGVGGGIGNSFSSDIYALHFFNGELYAGGKFDSAGGVPAKNIAKWTGTAWTSVGAGINRTVFTFEEFNGELYAGGYFDSTGTTCVNSIVKWNGTDWVDVGGGTDHAVLTLCVFNNELYAGGYFQNAGGILANRVAKWNGTNWDTVGIGFNAVVRKLYVYNNELYAGGDFTPFPLNPSRIISKLNGNTWQALPSPAGGNYPAIRDFVSFNGELYVTGDFFAPSRIAKFSGSSYDSLGAGLSTSGACLMVFNNELYVGGYFAWAGNNIPNTSGLAKWNSTVGVFEDDLIKPTIIFPNPFNNQTTFHIDYGLGTKYPCQLNIYNELGIVVKQISKIYESTYILNKENLSIGIYFYEILDKSNNKIGGGKLVID